MKRTKLIRNVILIVVFGLLLILLLIFVIGMIQRSRSDSNYLIISQTCSSADSWGYQLSRDDILKEISRTDTIKFSDKTQKWKFEIIGEGEISIRWIFYNNGDTVLERKSFTTTYLINNDGSYSLIDE